MGAGVYPFISSAQGLFPLTPEKNGKGKTLVSPPTLPRDPQSLKKWVVSFVAQTINDTGCPEEWLERPGGVKV